jgi:hypothetical protein
LIDADRNILQKELEKKLKYKNMRTEIHRIWNMKCFAIPVVIEATGIVTRGLKICVNNTRKTSIDSVQENSCIRNIAHNKENATV